MNILVTLLLALIVVGIVWWVAEVIPFPGPPWICRVIQGLVALIIVIWVAQRVGLNL